MKRRLKRAKQKHRQKSAIASATDRNNIQSSMQQAVSLHRAGNLQEAENIYWSILEREPHYADALHLLGVIAYQTDSLNTALQLMGKAIEVNFQRAAYHSDLGNVLKKLGRLSEAVETYKRAIQLAPNLTEAMHNLANTLRVLGDFQEAASWFRRILASQPQDTEIHRNLSNLVDHTEYDDDMLAMEKLLTLKDLNDKQRTDLQYALGKAFEDIGNYERSFQLIELGNHTKRKSFQYDISEDEKLIEKQIQVFNEMLFKKNSGYGHLDATPLFIIGMPRSGTTLVEQILASHPQVFGAGELETLKKTVFESKYFPNSNNYPEQISSLTPEDFDLLGARYIKQIRQLSTDTKHITDKMPHNFLFVGLIKLILPRAKIIHCQRDPRDTCFSCYKTDFTLLHRYTYDLAELGTYFNLYAKLMSHWQKLLPDFIFDVKYEDLLSDQVGQTKRLIKFCGLEWDETCLTFHHTKRPIHTASAVQVRRPLYRSSVKLWERYEKQLTPLLKVLDQPSV